MPSRSCAALLFAELQAHLGVEAPNGAISSPHDVAGFTLVFENNTSVRVDYDEEDELIWLTTPIFPPSSTDAERWLPALLELNCAGAAHGLARTFDLDSGAVFLQSRIERTAVRVADFEEILTAHLQAVELTERGITTPAAEGAESTPAGPGPAEHGLPSAGPLIWG